MGTFLLAVGAAAVFAVFSFPFRLYQCWYSWNRLGTNLGLLLYLSLAGGGGGGLGWICATLANAQPTSIAAVDAVLFGIGGALVLRAEFRPLADGRSNGVRDPRASRAGQFREATSALAASMNWVAGLLDDVLSRRAHDTLGAKSDDELKQHAWVVGAHISTRADCPQAAKKKMMDQLLVLMEILKEKPEKRDEVRAQIVAFCTTYITAAHMTRTR